MVKTLWWVGDLIFNLRKTANLSFRSNGYFKLQAILQNVAVGLNICFGSQRKEQVLVSPRYKQKLALFLETRSSFGSWVEEGSVFPAEGRCICVEQGQDVQTYTSHQCFLAAPHSFTSIFGPQMPCTRPSFRSWIGFFLDGWHLKRCST